MERSPSLPFTTETRFARSGHLRVPATPGVYLIFDWRGPLYVGRTRDLQVRFLQHLEESHNEALNHAVGVPFGPVRFAFGELPLGELVAAEAHAIDALNPSCNAR